MAKSAKIDFHLVLKLIGATLGAVGFYLSISQKYKLLGIAFIGLGSFIIAIGEG